MAQAISKDPAATMIVGIDWVNQLGSGVTLEDVSWDVPADLTNEEEEIDGSRGLLLISGGSLGSVYTLLGTGTLSDGQILPFRLYVSIVQQ